MGGCRKEGKKGGREGARKEGEKVILHPPVPYRWTSSSHPFLNFQINDFSLTTHSRIRWQESLLSCLVPFYLGSIMHQQWTTEEDFLLFPLPA